MVTKNNNRMATVAIYILVLAEVMFTLSAKAHAEEPAACTLPGHYLSSSIVPPEFTCPAGCKPHEVKGNVVYTADSNICSAAAHAGLIKLETGGTVHVHYTGQVHGGFFGTDQNGISSGSSGELQSSFSFVATVADNRYFQSVWKDYFGPSYPIMDAQSLGHWSGRRKSLGCVSTTAEFVRAGIAFQPWNLSTYVAGVRGIGPGNSSYNYGFMTMSYKAIFGFEQSQASINYWLPLMDNGTLDARAILDSFLGDQASVAAHCAQFGL